MQGPHANNTSATHRIRVVFVDDHPLFRQGLRQLLISDKRFECVGEAGEGMAALELVKRENPDVMILDISLPGISGLEIARTLQTQNSRVRIVVLTMNKDEETFNRAIDFGVLGFVLKENAVEDILNSILAASKGEHYLSPSISSYLMHRRNRVDALAASKPGLSSLTKAELRVLKLIAMKKTSRQIGQELFISPRTVEAHRANICSKLNLSGSHSLLQFALENRSSME